MNKRQYAVASVVAAGFAVAVAVRSWQSRADLHAQVTQRACVENLRQIVAAKAGVAVAQGLAVDTPVLPEQVAQHAEAGWGVLRCPGGGTYSIGLATESRGECDAGTDAQAPCCSVHGSAAYLVRNTLHDFLQPPCVEYSHAGLLSDLGLFYYMGMDATGAVMCTFDSKAGSRMLLHRLPEPDRALLWTCASNLVRNVPGLQPDDRGSMIPRQRAESVLSVDLGNGVRENYLVTNAGVQVAAFVRLWQEVFEAEVRTNMHRALRR